MQQVLIGVGIGLALVFVGRYVNKSLDALEPKLGKASVGVSRWAWSVVRARPPATFSVVSVAATCAVFLALGEYITSATLLGAASYLAVSSELPPLFGRYRYVIDTGLMWALISPLTLYLLLTGQMDWPVTYLFIGGLIIAEIILMVVHVADLVRATHKLRELKPLLDDGVITQSEFEAKKAEILSELGPELRRRIARAGN